MKKILTSLLVLVLVSFTPPAKDELILKLSVKEVQIILKGLSKLPYEESAPIINKIQIQAQPQLTDTTKKK